MNYYIYTGREYHNGVWSDRILEKGDSISWSDLDPTQCPEGHDKKDIYAVPELMSGGDYANSSTVEVSNHRVFLEEFKDLEGVHEVWGGYGSFAVAIRVDVLENNEEIIDTLNGLENYPVINDEDLSNLENEKSEEAWNDWAESDMRRLLRDSHDLLDEDFIEDYDREDFKYLFYQCSEEAGEYWEAESGGSMYIRLESIAPYMRDRLLLAKIPDKDLPLLVSHTWVSKKALEEFQNKLKGVHCES